MGGAQQSRAREEAFPCGEQSRAREEAIPSVDQNGAGQEAVALADRHDALNPATRAQNDPPRAKPPDSEPIAAGFTAGGSPSRAQRREARFQEAVRGLTYATGRVVLADDWPAVRDERWSGESFETLIQRGSDNLRRDVFAAIEAFTLAVLIDPERVEGYRGLGRAMYSIHRVTCAIAAFHTALDIEPAATDGRFELGMALQMKGDFAEAAGAWEELVTLDPGHADGHARLAIALGFLADYEAAWDHVHAAESLGRRVPPQFRVLLASKFPEP
jgi:cytochrome c-type biogenesis protein CcmH/NrfG